MKRNGSMCAASSERHACRTAIAFAPSACPAGGAVPELIASMRAASALLPLPGPPVMSSACVSPASQPPTRWSAHSRPTNGGVAVALMVHRAIPFNRSSRAARPTIVTPRRSVDMVDPLSLGGLGALAATEGIKFLYAQASELLKRWRDRKAGKETEADEPIPVTAGDVLEGTLAPLRPDLDAVDRLGPDIKAFARVLGDYAGGLEEPSPNDRDLVDAADGLRRALEVVYGQRITFKGERREASGPIVVGLADVDKVAGDVAGVRARLVRSGRVHGELHAEDVTGKASGTEVDTVG
jgi:hypothetical protein